MAHFIFKISDTDLIRLLILVTTIALCYLISGLVFGYGGWGEPVFVGFRVEGAEVDTTNVHAVTQGVYVLMQAGLIWFAAMVVALIALMISVLVRSTAASFVTMMAAIISGTLLANMASSWKSAKYLFNVNLELSAYLRGTPPPWKACRSDFRSPFWRFGGLRR